MAVEIPHFAYPFGRGDNGKVAVVEQDTIEDVMACENVIVRCPIGFREERPDFGWAFPTFQTGELDLSSLTSALAQFEPRGDADVTPWEDEANAAVRNVTVEVST